MMVKLKRKYTTLICIVGLLLLGITIKPVTRYVRQAWLFSDLYDAVMSGNVPRMRALLRMGASSEGVGRAMIGGTPLMWATRRSDIKMIRALVQEGANVNTQDAGYTALMGANSPQVAQLLVDMGADPTIRSGEGLTAWQYAKYGRRDSVAQVIIRGEKKWRSSDRKSSA